MNIARKQRKKTQKKNVAVLVRLWEYLAHYRWLFAGALGLALFSNILSLLVPLISGYAIDAIQPGIGNVDFDRVWIFAGWMTGAYVCSALLNYFLSIMMIRLSRKVVFKLRCDAFNKLADLPVEFFDRHQTGDIISIISYDIDTISASLSTDLLQVCASVITVIGSLVMMVMISPRLALVFAFTIPASIIFTRYRSNKVRPLYAKRSKKLGELNGFVEEIINGQKTIKAYDREKVMIERFDIKNEEAVQSNYMADYYGVLTGSTINFINNASLALISLFGALMYLAQTITLGNISSFVLYSRRFAGPINEFANIITDFQSSLAAAKRVFNLIDEKPEKADDPDAFVLSDVEGNVDIENMSFGYDVEKTVIHDLTLHAPKGSIIAIVGPTGSGKTTIINLLMRFYDVDRGAILIDRHNIQDVTRQSLRTAYTMVLQDVWLFHGTIFENIAYGKENVTFDDVVRVAKAAKIHNYIMSLPDGYETVLIDNGQNISKGQQQLLTIARAMLIDSKILILDEATSNVDTQTERQIQNAMLALMKGRTSFVIAHRLSTIQNADLILVLRNGQIVEQGTHDALIKRSGYYAELYRSQFETY